MSLTDADVLHVATLARLGLSHDEVATLRTELSSILGHIEVLQQLDTSAIPPTAQVNDLTNVLREDVVAESLPQSEVLANAPQHRSGFFEVRAVLGDGDEVTA